GFGVQLGLGVVTIVTTATVYATWMAAVLSGGAPAGAAIGATFGLARALPVLGGGGGPRSHPGPRQHPALRRLATPARRPPYATSVALAAAALAGAARW